MPLKKRKVQLMTTMTKNPRLETWIGKIVQAYSRRVPEDVPKEVKEVHAIYYWLKDLSHQMKGDSDYKKIARGFCDELERYVGILSILNRSIERGELEFDIRETQGKEHKISPAKKVRRDPNDTSKYHLSELWEKIHDDAIDRMEFILDTLVDVEQKKNSE